MQKIISCSASYARESNTVAVTTHWHIPEGCDYQNAIVIQVFWSDQNEAESFASRYSNFPESAYCIPILKWDKLPVQPKCVNATQIVTCRRTGLNSQNFKI